MKIALVLVVVTAVIAVACSSDDNGSDDAPATVEIIEIEVGLGDTVVEGDRVEVHYIGLLEDGTAFDSSRDRDEPFTFRVGAGEVIAGWDEGLLGMAQGGFRRLIIPPELAYGDQARGNIPANSELTFEIELLSISECGVAAASPPPIDANAETFTTENGVQVIVIEKGSAEDPTQNGDGVTMNYTGWLTADGTMFDSSYNRCEEFTFQLGAGEVIQGWDEGILGMSPGDVRRLIIPAELAYGEAGRTSIPANSSLTFDVELVAFGRNTPVE